MVSYGPGQASRRTCGERDATKSTQIYSRARPTALGGYSYFCLASLHLPPGTEKNLCKGALPLHVQGDTKSSCTRRFDPMPTVLAAADSDCGVRG